MKRMHPLKIIKDNFPLTKPDLHALMQTAMFAFFEAACIALGLSLVRKLYDTGIVPDGHMHMWIIVAFLSFWATSALISLNNYHAKKFSLLFQNNMKRSLAGALSTVSPEAYDHEFFLRDFALAKEAADNADRFLSGAVMVLFFFIPYFAFTGIFLFRQYPLLLFIPVAVALPSIFAQRIHVHLQLEKAKKNSLHKSRADTLLGYFYQRKDAKEIASETKKNVLAKHLTDNLSRVRDADKIYARKMTGLELLSSTVSYAGFAVSFSICVILVLQRNISIGAFVVVVNVIESTFIYSNELFGYYVSDLTKSWPYMIHYFSFLELCSSFTTHDKTNSVPGVSLTDVSYYYPGQKEPALNKVSLQINPGESVAIVGENGSGKTTLAKILLGLIVPTEGTVSKNDSGEDSAESASDVPYGFTVLFQDYNKYLYSTKRNITISDSWNTTECVRNAMCRNDHGTKEECAAKCAAETGVTAGMEEMLSVEFGGRDLSEGQWQRVAMARTLFRERPLIVFDEPTASLDAVQETEIYDKMKEWSQHKTCIIVSHRMASALLADRIIVMNHGRILENGTFDELIRTKGLFYKMYTVQAEWYQTEPIE